MDISRDVPQAPAETSNPGQIPTRIDSITEVVDRNLREVYLAQLIFAARDLARQRVTATSEGFLCLSCDGYAREPRNLTHMTACNVGRVLRLLAALTEVPPISQPERRPCEEISSEQAIAADPHPPRATSEFREPWRWCEADGFRGIEDADGLAIVDACDLGVDDPEERRYCDRILACVNVCAGVSIEILQSLPPGFVQTLLEEHAEHVAVSEALLSVEGGSADREGGAR